MRLPLRVPSRESRPLDVVTFGLNSIDLIAVVDEHPARNSKAPLEAFSYLPGGQMATASAVCARLGWRASYVGVFGDDSLGVMGRDSLTAEGVDLSGAWTSAGATNQFAVVIVERRTGARTVLWNRHAKLAIDPSRVPLDVVGSGRILIVDCQETAAAATAARRARRLGIATIVDVERVRPGVEDLLAEIDIIAAAQSLPEELTGYSSPGRALAAIAEAFRAPIVCVTLGEEGSLAVCGGREIRTRGFPVDAVDTTGAGDAFRGGLAAGCLRAPDGDVEDVLRYANAVAALNCRGLGARGAMPSSHEVDALLLARSQFEVLDS